MEPLAPSSVELQKALQLHQNGKVEEAKQLYLNILKHTPNEHQAALSLGILFQEQKQFNTSLDYLERALAQHPNHPLYLLKVAEVSFELEAYRKVIESTLKAAEKHALPLLHARQLALSHLKCNQTQQAIHLYQKLIESNQAPPLIWLEYGNALRFAGLAKQACHAYEQAIRFEETKISAMINLGMMLLSFGQDHEGWQAYRWRFHNQQIISPQRAALANAWQGEPLQGKSILFLIEQGFGDTIQFVRYLPHFIEMGADVHLECQPALCSLIQTIPGVKVIPEGQPLPDCDTSHSLMDCHTLLEPIPAIDFPYLHCETRTLEGLDPQKRSIGLVWRGEQNNPREQWHYTRRSTKLTNLHPLIELDHCQFFSFQKDPYQEEIQLMKNKVIRLDEQMHDFHDTACLLQAMDLIITIDTACAHLAASLNKEVWLLLPFEADWRWLRESDQSPWYPNMILFRQTEAGDWNAPIETIKQRLKK